jgi:hypothetical protein
MRTRVTSVLIFAAVGLSPPAPLLGGVLLETAGKGAAFALFAVLTALAAVTATFGSGVRAMKNTA